ncbi:LexA/Signal peptidase [Gyrodon lividus]|nr:LexA/Signal peptidase [Gyrodon lividus]
MYLCLYERPPAESVKLVFDCVSNWLPMIARLRHQLSKTSRPISLCSHTSQFPSFKSPSVWKRAFRALYWLPLGIAFTHYFYTIKTVRGRSMQPTLNPDVSGWDDIVVFDRFTVISGRPIEKGDVVSLRDPIDNRKMIVKRVMAVSGDIVKTLPPYPNAEVLVPEGHIWVEGKATFDVRCNVGVLISSGGDEPFRTLDSNKFGPVPLALVDAKLSYIIWPLDRIGPLEPPAIPVTTTGAPRNSQWYSKMAAFERERKRRARVTQAPADVKEGSAAETQEAPNVDA